MLPESLNIWSELKQQNLPSWLILTILSGFVIWKILPSIKSFYIQRNGVFFGHILPIGKIKLEDAAAVLYDGLHGTEYFNMIKNMGDTPEARLKWCRLEIVSNIEPLFGKEPPSVVVREVQWVSGFWPFEEEDRRNCIGDVIGSAVKYTDVSVRRRDLKAHIKKQRKLSLKLL